MKNRSRLEIKAKIVETIGENGAIQSKIMYTVYLSFLQMKKYLDTLQNKNLITFDTNVQIYKLTDKGNISLRCIKK